MTANAAAIVDDVLTEHIVGGGSTLVLCPPEYRDQLTCIQGQQGYSLCHSIRPALTHTSSLGGLKAASSTTTSHAVGDTMRILHW